MTTVNGRNNGNHSVIWYITTETNLSKIKYINGVYVRPFGDGTVEVCGKLHTAGEFGFVPLAAN